MSLQDRLLEALTPLVANEGYELVYLEVQTHRAKTVRIFIDHLDAGKDAIGVEDCVKVTKALDEPLDKLTDAETVLAGGFELEVSSPGIDRPLRKEADFERFKEREVRLHVFRALTAEELRNEDYAKRNPKQKNFLGILKGMKDGSVLLAVPASMGSTAKKGLAKPKPKKGQPHPLKAVKEGAQKMDAAKDGTKGEKFDEIAIPHSLISKANLEPDFASFEQDESKI